jgi:quercetin dioxygenase-like cupin family protein
MPKRKGGETMKRREVLKIGGMAAIAGVFARFAAAEKTWAQPALVKGHTPVLRIYADAQGNSHLEELLVVTAPSGRGRREAKPLPVTGVLVREYAPRESVDWHTTPARQFAITVVGELEVEVSGGVKRRVRTGELVFLEDTKGKGHITRLGQNVTNLFIRVADDFDFATWARKKA